MTYILLALAVFGLITSTVYTGLVLWAVPCYLREGRWARDEEAKRPGFTPPLTLLKPVHGSEPGLEEHLATFFAQDYPEYESSSAPARPTTLAWRRRGVWPRAIHKSR